MRELFNTIFHAGGAPQQQGRGEAARLFARFAVLGAFVLGVAPGGWAALAQARRSADAAGVKKTSRAETPKAEAPRAAAEKSKVDVKPIKAFLARSRRLHEQGRLKLSEPQSVVVEGDRGEDGALTNVRISGDSAADPVMRAVAQDFANSVNESRALAFLTDVSHVRMTFVLENERFKALTASDAPSEARAEEMARGYRMLINVGRLARRGTDEGAILSGMKVSASGKQLLMNLDMPREQMGNILLRQITPN
ncbi:MAG TPA: hypothetical protein VF668_18915 [Pyrinomonadaceae bacterium]|jgi:hypothetical protein